jgi:hypothetical protein
MSSAKQYIRARETEEREKSAQENEKDQRKEILLAALYVRDNSPDKFASTFAGIVAQWLNPDISVYPSSDPRNDDPKNLIASSAKFSILAIPRAGCLAPLPAGRCEVLETGGATWTKSSCWSPIGPCAQCTGTTGRGGCDR